MFMWSCVQLKHLRLLLASGMRVPCSKFHSKHLAKEPKHRKPVLDLLTIDYPFSLGFPSDKSYIGAWVSSAALDASASDEVPAPWSPPAQLHIKASQVGLKTLNSRIFSIGPQTACQPQPLTALHQDLRSHSLFFV